MSERFRPAALVFDLDGTLIDSRRDIATALNRLRSELGLPPLSLGFVYGPALLGIVAGSVLTAPIGARAAHRLPLTTLRRIFAGLLYLLATKMLWSYL